MSIFFLMTNSVLLQKYLTSLMLISSSTSYTAYSEYFFRALYGSTELSICIRSSDSSKYRAAFIFFRVLSNFRVRLTSELAFVRRLLILVFLLTFFGITFDFSQEMYLDLSFMAFKELNFFRRSFIRNGGCCCGCLTLKHLDFRDADFLLTDFFNSVDFAICFRSILAKPGTTNS